MLAEADCSGMIFNPFIPAAFLSTLLMVGSLVYVVSRFKSRPSPQRSGGGSLEGLPKPPASSASPRREVEISSPQTSQASLRNQKPGPMDPPLALPASSAIPPKTKTSSLRARLASLRNQKPRQAEEPPASSATPAAPQQEVKRPPRASLASLCNLQPRPTKDPSPPPPTSSATPLPPKRGGKDPTPWGRMASLSNPQPGSTGDPRERRRHLHRRGKPIKAALSNPAGDQEPIPCWVTDRSRGGLGLITKQPLEIGARHEIRALQAPEGLPGVAIEVRTCRQKGRHWLIGCQFTDELTWSVLLLFG